MADILNEEIFSSLNFRVQSFLRMGGQCPPLSKVGGQLPPLPPFSYTTGGDSLQDWSSDSISSHQTQVKSPAVQKLRLQLAQAPSASLRVLSIVTKCAHKGM